jgi:hypothetical protein
LAEPLSGRVVAAVFNAMGAKEGATDAMALYRRRRQVHFQRRRLMARYARDAHNHPCFFESSTLANAGE